MLIDLVKAKVRDAAARLTDPEDFEGAIAAAIARYSKDRPRVVAADLAGNGTHDLTLPATWVAEYSRVTRLEYPLGEIPERFVDSSDYAVYQAPSGEVLRLKHETPEAGETVRAWFTVPWTEAQVPSLNADAVANLAASVCLRQLAASYGDATDPTLQADVVNHRSKIDEYRRLAEALEAQYKAHFGLKDQDTVAAACAVVSAPEPDDRVRLTHGTRS